ncbi:MAG: glycosyltransferase family 2 protein, partial [Candidatus Odinarchaeota archaeon]
MPRKIPVSLVVPTYNRLLKLFRLLKSLNNLDPLPDEVIIIDDYSKDRTPDLLKRWEYMKNGFTKKIVLKNQNKGPAHSRNIGIEVALNDLVAFLDDDVVVKNDWMKKITNPLFNGEKDLAGVGGVVKAFTNHIIGQYYVIHKILEAPTQLNYLPTVNCCFKKKHLIDVGGFDTSISFAGGEDTDLCL